MKSLTSNDWLSIGIKIAFMAIVVKALMVAAAFFLPKSGVDSVPYEPDGIYAGYKPSKLFALAGPVKKQPKKVPVYKLDKLQLKGVFDDPEMPFIAVQEGKKVVLISKGETFKGYKLIEVHPDRAVFDKGGRHYELRFKEDKSAAKSSITAATPEVINEGEAVFVKRNEIRHYAKNYDDIWKNVKIQEIIKNKRLQGFKVTWVKKGSIFEKIGLKKDDVIVGANDKKFKSLSQVFKLYNNVEKIDSMKLTVIREGQERELEYEIFE